MDNKTVIYYADVSPLEDGELYGALYSAAPRHRREKTDRLVRPDARRLSLGAWSLFSAALEKRGVTREFEIAYGDMGKPYLKDIPDLHFNLSHSGSVAMCALSDVEIGCDVELIASPRPRVAERFFSPEEREYLASVAKGETARAFYKIWTLKESFLKAIGKGFSVPPSSFSVIADGKIGIKQDLSPVEWRLFTAEISPLYSTAYCAQPEGTATLCRIDLASRGK